MKYKTFANRAYFAAANGYSGFRSYFNKIFDSAYFDTVFILKGGPGTGKSSMLKAFSKHFFEMDMSTEAFFCSSDTGSLDGVIITNGERRIAMLDGTAPHERDAVIPGATDELVNLGDSWLTSHLKAKRDIILSLNKQKKNAYARAYEYLSLAGKAHRLAEEIIKKYVDNERAERTAKIVASTVSKESSAQSSVRLYRAFGKSGIEELDPFNGETVIKLSNPYGCGALLLGLIKKELKTASVGFLDFPSVLSDELTDAISVGSCVYRLTDGDCDIDTSELIIKPHDSDLAVYSQLITAHDELLSLASGAFLEASSEHFKLEEIYKGAMDFSKNDLILSKLIKKSEKLFGL